MTPLQKKRAEAKAKGEMFFTTDEPCRHGHMVDRYTCSGACVECYRQKQTEYRLANLEKYAEISRRHRARRGQAYRDYIREYKQEYYQTPEGKERCKAAAKRWQVSQTIAGQQAKANESAD